MRTESTIPRSRYGSGSSAGAVIAGGVIVALTMIFCVLLLIFFWHPCCCCCRAPEKTAAVASSGTFFSPNPHIGGTAAPASWAWMPRHAASTVSTVAPVSPEPAHKAFSPEPLAAPSTAPGTYYTGTHGGFLPPIGFGPMPGLTWGGPSSSSSAPASGSTVLPPPVISVPEPNSLAVMLGGLTLGLALFVIGKRSA